MQKPLYKLADDFIELAQALIDEVDMPNEIIDELLDAHTGEFSEKAWNVAAMVLQFDAEADMVRAAEKRMTTRRKTLESRADWLRDYLLVQLIRTGTHELSSAEFVVKVCDNPPRTVIDDEDAIPDDYKEAETVINIKKAELRSAMLDGEIIPGVHLEKAKRLKFS